MSDPDVEVKINAEKEEAEALTFQNDYLGIYQTVYEDDKCNTKLQKDLNVFLDDWLSNIINSEYELTEKEEDNLSPFLFCFGICKYPTFLFTTFVQLVRCFWKVL